MGLLWKKDVPADVCLVLEGTYPYVSGGVSTWVHQIISALPEVKFSIAFIGAEQTPDMEYQYELPSNVVTVKEFFLYDSARRWAGAPAGLAGVPELVENCRQALNAFGTPIESRAFDIFFSQAAKVARRQSLDQVWKDSSVWDLISEVYDRRAPETPFLDFFWACRFLAAPVWKMLGNLHRIPAARLYHSPSTGYAGLVASLAAKCAEAPFLLSEHGIYVRERIAEIHGARWIEDVEPARAELLPKDSALRSMWIGFFALLARYAYKSAGRITSLFAANAAQQVAFGAQEERIDVIPNGIALEEFEGVVKRREAWLLERGHPVVGFLGRIVAIKDVKTLLDAAALVLREVPGARFVIAGPTAEEPGYFRECEELRERLGIAEAVIFSGITERGELLSRIDVMALTSVSEGLPFVVLEAFAAGVPVVSTDVGACPELILGSDGESPALGAAGAVASTGDVRAIARALIDLLRNPDKARAMGRAGRDRVKSSYRQKNVVGKFRELYTGGTPNLTQPLPALEEAIS